MKLKSVAAALLMSLAAAACQQIPDDMSVVEYCAKQENAAKDLCKVNVEIDGQKRALAETNMSLGQARQIADSALARANAAQSSADAARAAAAAAADAAKVQAAFNCETRTVQRSKVGSCAAGYKVQSCVQTRFTTRAGGPSILREITDDSCRFNDKVLEMQIRCCMTGPQPAATPTAAPLVEKPAAPRTPAKSS